MRQLAHVAATAERVHIGAFIDRETRRQLSERARQEDRSVSAIVRRALEAELQRDAEGVES